MKEEAEAVSVCDGEAVSEGVAEAQRELVALPEPLRMPVTEMVRVGVELAQMHAVGERDPAAALVVACAEEVGDPATEVAATESVLLAQPVAVLLREAEAQPDKEAA